MEKVYETRNSFLLSLPGLALMNNETKIFLNEILVVVQFSRNI